MESGVGFVAAFVLISLLTGWLRGAVYYDPHLVLLSSYAVVWVPFLGAVLVASYIRGTRSLARDIGLRITWLDVFFGVGAGLLARAAAGLVEIALTGRMVGMGVSFGDAVYDGWWLFGTILAPVLLAPFIEELFFRGLLLRAVHRASIGLLGSRTATVIAILVSSLLFALLHLTQAANPMAALILGVSAFLFGLAAATIAAFTGRIGGSIVAHIVFNGALVLTSL
ncbi:hypothetical protein SAMN06295943_0168 [Agreia sp. VKM Ac-1783]|nr:hypothetical protein SAMN06295943_0168 [Agreia sp. VKM Ac-1783]